MPEEEPESHAPAKRITFELRRFLGMPRSVRARRAKERQTLEEAEATARGEEAEPAPSETDAGVQRSSPAAPVKRPDAEQARTSQSVITRTPRIGVKSSRPDRTVEDRKVTQPSTTLALDEKSARASEMRQVVLIIGAILLLFFGFYAGRRIDYWKYLYVTRVKPNVLKKPVDQFPGVSAEELLNRGLAAEHDGKLKKAAELLAAAKYKNFALPGVLFHVGKLAYTLGDLKTADKIFDRAVALRENVDSSIYYRGLISLRRRNFLDAQSYFEAAAKAEPFVSEYCYYWAEALRMDFHPKDAIPHYLEAAVRAREGQDPAVCSFKIRMARIEAGEGASVRAELQKQKSAGRLSVDWIMTDAALNIYAGQIDLAVRLVNEAWAAYQPALFSSCSQDSLFSIACQKRPQLAKACHLNLPPRPAFP
jgi:tetratricopeptide (TPR) repeat protein